jgi:hypothetical protein
LFAIAAVCSLLLIAGIAISSDPNITSKTIDGKKAADVNDANDINGPTVTLSYDIRTVVKNPISSFMYFVPLVSPTLVEVETSADNNQQTGLVSYERKITSKSFYVACEFEMTGKGFFKTRFNPPEIIEICLAGSKTGKPVANALDYFEFEGEGLGCIEVRGTISGSTRIVDRVDVHFNTKGRKSPVTIGLYSVAPQDGQYKYENRYGELIARVATLTFKKCDGRPTMGVKVVSVNKAAKRNGFIGKIRGAIANFFIDPPVVSEIGNDTMLDFGLALLNEKPSFTFPLAKNIKKPEKN